MGGSAGSIASIVAAPFTGGTSLLMNPAISNSLIPKPPKVDTSAVDTKLGLIKAQNAVQSKEAEERRTRAAKRVQTVLTGGLGITGTTPSAAASLQPTEARKSVLG